MVWIALFAGYGGTSNLAYETLKMIRKVRGLRYPVTCCERMASHDPLLSRPQQQSASFDRIPKW